ncbi:hypothetical protein KFU94_06290 [Chloroflexi bacterium TSY]|nr:hypothetical protein [Chloroflexi bacterium TSY]
MATSSLVAQNLGARQPEQAMRVGYRASLLAMVSMSLIGLSYFIAAEPLMRIFSQEQTVIEAGIFILRLIAIYQLFDAVGIVFSSALNGAGDTTFTMVTRSILSWGLFLPLAWYLTFTREGGIQGAWSAAVFYLTLLSIIFFLRFRSGRWQQIELH